MYSIIDFPKQLLYLVNQTLRLFGEYIFRSSRPGLKKSVLKNVTKFTGSICARLFFSISCKLETYNFIRRETLAKVLPREFCEIFMSNYFVEHLRTVVAVYCATNIKREKGLRVGNMLLIHLI